MTTNPTTVLAEKSVIQMKIFLEGWGASEDLQPVALRRAGYTAAQSKSYGDKPGAPEIIKANRETPVKYLKGIYGYSSKKVAQPTGQLKCLYTSIAA